MEAPPVLQARALTRRYGARVALDALDLALPEGSALAVYGANGAGKTTLLKLAAGLCRPTGGTIAVRGVDPRKAPERARAAVGYLGHASLLYDDLTVFENLRFFATLHGLEEPARRADQALAEHGIEDRRDEPVRGLSRGLRQRAALARALLHEPSLLLLDEPTTGLDADAVARLRERLAAVTARKGAMLLATHDVPLGTALCERWIRLDRGRVVLSGTGAP